MSHRLIHYQLLQQKNYYNLDFLSTYIYFNNQWKLYSKGKYTFGTPMAANNMEKPVVYARVYAKTSCFSCVFCTL